MLYTTVWTALLASFGCFIRISKILLYAIHNGHVCLGTDTCVVLSGFQRYFCMLYTTYFNPASFKIALFYQDFKDTFVCYTQRYGRHCLPRSVVLSGFQRYFCMLYTTYSNTALMVPSCFIRISKILLYAIHNLTSGLTLNGTVVLSGFQRYFCMLYTTVKVV